jgi:hypothetical protein
MNKRSPPIDTIFQPIYNKYNMPVSLKSYFIHLAAERDTDCENLTIIVDNAHIPVHFTIKKDVNDTMEGFSRSLSAINCVSFPPPFLKDTTRWESMKGSSNSDFSLSVPSRSRDDLDRNLLGHSLSRKNFGPCSSLDSTERMLRKLPTQYSPMTRRREQCPALSPAYAELPSLKECSYDDEVETHPIVALRGSSENSLEGLLSIIDLEDDHNDDSENDSNGSGAEDCGYESEDVSIPDDDFEKEEPQLPNVSLETKLCSSSQDKHASHEDDWPNRKPLKSTVSWPRTLFDFPYTPTSPLRRSPRPADLQVGLERESVELILERGRLLDCN